MFKPNFRTLAAISAISILSVSVNAFALGSRPKVNDEGTNTRIAPVARVQLAAASAAAGKSDRSGEQLYKAACSACHETGAAGSPKLGDKAAWAPRISLGLDGLLKSAIAGKNAMPPKGGSDANDTELARAIVYMANKAGASFKEPAAAK
jgi:cytochrome c5